MMFPRYWERLVKKHPGWANVSTMVRCSVGELKTILEDAFANGGSAAIKEIGWIAAPGKRVSGKSDKSEKSSACTAVSRKGKAG